MLCDICHIREATIKFTQVVNLKKKEMNVCKQCAEEKGMSNPLVGLQKIFGKLLNLDQLSKTTPETGDEEDDDLYCDTCQLSWREFQKDGLLGCRNCYTVFEEKLNVILRRIHGSNKHIGNRPRNLRETLETDYDLDDLKNQLKRAIESEKFELAAQLRDRIKDIEANEKKYNLK